MIKTTLKKSLSLILAMVMVFSMIPASVMNVFAADYVVGNTITTVGNKTVPSAPANTVWVETGSEQTCGYNMEHAEHTLACYSCGHYEGHVRGCYDSAVWTKCSGDGCGHLDYVTLDRSLLSNLSKLDAELASTLIDEYGIFGILDAIGTTYCYKASEANRTCGTHGASGKEHTDACISSLCPGLHTPHGEPDCYTYTWTLMKDSDGDGTPDAASVIADKDGEAVYYSALEVADVKANIFNAIYDSANSTPSDLTVDDVTIEVYVTIPVINTSDWYDITTSIMGYSVFNLIQTVANTGSIQARINYAGSDTQLPAVSDGATVTLADPRSEVTVSPETVELAFAETGMLDAFLAALTTDPEEGIVYRYLVSELTDEVLYNAAKANPAGITVTATYAGDDAYKPLLAKTIAVTFTGVYYNVTLEGGTAGNESVLKANHGTALEFTLDTVAGKSYTVSLPDGSEAVLTNKGNVYTLANVTEDITLTVTATDIDYTVTFKVDGEVYDENTYKYGDTVKTPAAPTKEGYVFVAWEPDVESTVSADKTYNATWNMITYIWVDDDLTEIARDDYSDGSLTTPADPTKANSSFKGWDIYVSADGLTVTYTATYTADKVVTVTFKVDGEQYGEIQYINVTNGGKVASVEDPDKANAIFNGWDSDVIGTTPTENVVVNATWIEETNDNNVVDTKETIKVTVENGSVTIDDASVSGESFVYDSTKASHTIVVTPNANYIVDAVTLNGTELTGTLNGNVLTIADVALANGDTLVVTFLAYDPTAAGSITINGLKNGLTGVDYNTGMSVDDITKLISDNLDITFNPAWLAERDYTIKYKASEAGTVPLTINLSNLNLGVLGNLLSQYLPETITVDVPVEEKWMDIGEPFPETKAPTNAQLKKIAEDLITKYASNLSEIFSGGFDTSKLKADFEAVLAENQDIKDYYTYLGAHQFGTQLVETIRIEQADYVSGDSTKIVTSNTYNITLEDKRAATTIKLNSGVSLVYGQYNTQTLLDAILDGVYAGSDKIENAEVVFVTDVKDLPASEGIEIKVKYAGDANYKPSEATTTIVINKAPVSVTIDNQVVKYGTSYNKLPVSTSPAGVETIKFIVGLDISDVNFEGTQIKGILGNVQLLIPAELQSMLSALDGILANAGVNVTFADGASMKLSELQKAVDTMDDFFAGSEYEEYFRVLVKMLESIPTEAADVQITVGGTLPTNIGAYLIGAVTANANYETAYNVGVLVITPDGIKADIAWNEEMDGIGIPKSFIAYNTFDPYASATGFTYGEEGVLADATAQIVELFVGLGIDGSFVLETDAKALTHGAYVEIAMIVNWGNQMYYSEPIARPFVVIADELNVSFTNPDRLVTFDNAPQNDIESIVVTEKQSGATVTDYTVTYYYVGLQTNGKPYAATTAPTHAGAYTVTALVETADGKNGCAIGALVIKPAAADISVATKAEKFTGNAVDTSSLIALTSDVSGITPDTTVITAMINTDGSFSENGLKAIEGDINVDLPAWLDAAISEYAILADGISVGDFATVIGKVEAKLADLGVASETLTTLKNTLSQFSDTAILTFKDQDEIAPKAVGAYLVVAVVTDSDFVPAVGAGVLVIYPDAREATIVWNTADANSNGVLLRPTFADVDLGATATAVDGAELPVHNIFVGVNENGEIVLNRVLATSNENMNDIVAENGVYAQIAYITSLDSVIYYAEPQVRLLVVTTALANVEITDVNGNKNIAQVFTYDGQPHGVTVTVNGQTDVDGLKVYYIGSDTTVDGWYRTEAPTDAGVYTVVAIYIGKDANGKLVSAGTAIGVIVINPADTNVGLTDTTVKYDGNGYFAGITNEVLDYITIAIDRKTNTAYINIPADSKAHFDRLVAMLPAELGTKINAFVDKYSNFDGDVQSATVKAELTSIINDLIAYDLTQAKIAEAEALTNALINELKADVDVQAAVAQLKAELAALKSKLGTVITDDLKAEISDYLTAVLTAIESNTDVDVDAIKAELKAKIAALEAQIPESVVDELNAMVDEFIATVEANIDVSTIEAKIEELVNVIAAVDTEDIETLIKYVVGAAYGLAEQADLSEVKAVIYKAATKIEAQGYIEYIKYMVNSIASIYSPSIDTTEVEASINAMIAKIEEKLASGNFDADDIYAVETYLDDILASLLTIVDQIPDAKIVFGAYPTEIGVYDCYAINLSANYKSEFVSATLTITGKLLGDVDSDGDVDINDVVRYRRYLAEIITKNDLDLSVGDVNGDGNCDINDVVQMRRLLAEIITVFPAEEKN